MVILLANKFDCLHRYFDQEFWGYLKEHEDLVFDKVFDDLYNTQILLSNIEMYIMMYNILFEFSISKTLKN